MAGRSGHVPSVDPLAQRVARQPVPLLAFAQAMRETNSVFHRRLTRFQERHGALDDDMLCVAAQASFTCWFEASFPASLIAACRAISKGQANALSLCQQLDPQRWRLLHHYVIAAQRWLGVERSLPEPINESQAFRLAGLLGQPTPLRQALTRIYLWTLIAHLRHNVSLGQLCSDETLVQGSYANYAAWYADEKGHLYGDADRAQAFAARQRGTVRQAQEEHLEQIERLQAQLWRGRPEATRPACVQRFPRYQEIRMASIGALRWRGHLPDDPLPRQTWEALFASASRALEHWIKGDAPDDRLGCDLHTALGERTPDKVDLVRLFLTPPPEEGGFYAWLVSEAAAHGRNPQKAFAQSDTF